MPAQDLRYAAYTDTAYAETYWIYNGYPTYWANATSVSKNAAMIEATNWLDAQYGTVWKGERTSCDIEVQGRDWPRTGVEEIEVCGYLDEDTIPMSLQDATAYLAGEYLSMAADPAATLVDGDLMPSIEDPSRLESKRTKVGEIETEKRWVGGQDPAEQWSTGSFPRVEALVRGLITGTPGQGGVIRA